MLNIGRLGTNIDAVVAYYKSEAVHNGACIEDHAPPSTPNNDTPSVESYYLGKDRNQSGRWVGALREELGVHGAVQTEAFRRLLEGCHPLTGAALTERAAKAQQKRLRARRRPQLPNQADSVIDVATAAAHLEVSPQYVRRLLALGQADVGLEDKGPSWVHLSGTKIGKGNQEGPGRTRWRIPVAEVRRFDRAREGAATRPGFDLTLRPPKSVSVLWALGRPEWSEAIAKAHRDAVEEVLAYYESTAIFSRKRVGEYQQRIATQGLIGAAFDHRTSRAGDPLLHSHVVLFNLTKCIDGQWRALDGTPLYEFAKTGGYLYQAHLRHVLSRELGIEWAEVTNGLAEVVGIRREIIEAFSKRREEIEAAVAEAGYASPKAHQAATLVTRHAKGNEPEPPVALDTWWEEARTLGLTEADLEACVGTSAELRPDDKAKTSAFMDSLDAVFGELMSEEGLTQMMSNFARRDVLRELAERSIDELDAKALRNLAEHFVETAGPVQLTSAGKEADAIPDTGNVASAAGFSRFSTPELIDKEAQVLAWATKSLGTEGVKADDPFVEEALARHRELSDEQVDMVRRVTSGRQRLVVVVGDPGSGKTYATGIATEAFVASGVPVIGATVSSDAGEELALTTGLAAKTGRDASTISMLLIELDDPQWGGFAPGSVLILDEASMIPTRMLHRLVEHLDAAEGSLVLLGDPNQHGSVEAGGVYQHLVRHHGEAVIGLHENRRQSDEVERLAITEYREGKIKAALARYDNAGKVIRSETLKESYDAMATDWYVGWSLGERSPMLAGLNTMRRALNDRARVLLKSAGALGREVVIAQREFAIGDWVVAKKNNRKLRGTKGAWVKNGSLGTVTANHDNRGTMTIDFEREGIAEVPRSYLEEGNLDHAYARTTYGVQGKTLGTTAYQPSDLSGFEEGYVAVTRGRSGTRLYLVDDKSIEKQDLSCADYNDWRLDTELIVRALERKRAKIMAHDVGVSVVGDGVDV